MKADAMADLDVSIIQWLNQYSQMYPILDRLTAVTIRFDLFRAVVIVALLWWAWMGTRTRLVTDDLFLVRTILGITVAIAVARGLQNFLLYRPRPLHDQALDFRVPLGGPEDTLEDWSSFPSDHAVLIAALVVAVLLLNRSLGVLAAVWAACLPEAPFRHRGAGHQRSASLQQVPATDAHRIPPLSEGEPACRAAAPVVWCIGVPVAADRRANRLS